MECEFGAKYVFSFFQSILHDHTELRKKIESKNWCKNGKVRQTVLIPRNFSDSYKIQISDN